MLQGLSNMGNPLQKCMMTVDDIDSYNDIYPIMDDNKRRVTKVLQKRRYLLFLTDI